MTLGASLWNVEPGPPITLQPASCLSNEINNAVTHPILHGEHGLWSQENSFAKHLQDDLYFHLVQRDVLLRERERAWVINIQDTLPTNLRSRLSPTRETHQGEWFAFCLSYLCGADCRRVKPPHPLHCWGPGRWGCRDVGLSLKRTPSPPSQPVQWLEGASVLGLKGSMKPCACK